MNGEIKNRKRAAIYVRVSTEDQVNEGHGLDSQLSKCLSYIDSQDYTISDEHTFRDEGLSGTFPRSKRPGLNNLLESAKRKEFDFVIVYKIDRIARSLGLTIEIVKELKLYDIHIKSVTEPFDTSTPFGNFMLNFMANNAEFEKETIKMRMTDGRTSSAKKGNWVVGMPSFGYVKNEETKKLEIVEHEAEVVRMLYDWVIHEKLSLNKIAERINGMGINSPKHVMINKRVTHNHWWERTIGRILTNEIYTGVTYFRKYKRPYKNLTSILNDEEKRPQAEWIEQQVPPIITREIYDRATKQLLLNRTNSERNMKRDYLYSKLIYCGYCKFKMFSGYQPPRKGTDEYKTGRYYHGVYRKKDSVGTTKRCEWCPQYAESRLEPIWDTLLDILRNPKNLREPLERYSFKVVDAESVRIKQIRNDDKIKEIQAKLKKLATLFVNNESVELADFKRMEIQYTQEKEKLLNDNLRLQQSLLTKKDLRNREVVLEEMYIKIKDRLENVSYEDRKYIIHLFIESITVHARTNHAEVVFKFPTTTVLSNTSLDVSQTNMPLFLDIKTYSEYDIKLRVIKSNPGMGGRSE